MAPGPRKKNFNRKGGESGVEPKKNMKVVTEHPVKEIRNVCNKDTNESSDSLDKSYNKQSLVSNWDRYEEPVQDPYADTMRGEDFAVLSSYCGGSESQLQLQEEKEWEESVSDKSVTINLQELIKAVKSIPFHKQIGVPSDIFNEKQLSKFKSLSESYSDTLKPEADALPNVSSDKTFMKESKTLISDSNIIESYESEEVEIEAPTKVVTLEEKTESIIESLASCLSIKDSVPEKSVRETQMENKKTSSAIPDDLDFLLSLSASTKNVKQGIEKIKKQTNVDDWLNSILDD